MQFRYFEAPESEMSRLVDGIERCSFCGRESRCFEVEDQSGFGCYNCLREGRFGFSHTTEAGYLMDGKLVDLGYGEQQNRVFVAGPTEVAVENSIVTPAQHTNLAPEAVWELWRTPSFPTWNEVDWPVHCAEFMVFLGEWQPSEFASHDQFLEMTSAEYGDLWPKPDLRPEAWGITYFAFRCPSCGEHRGIVDYS